MSPPSPTSVSLHVACSATVRVPPSSLEPTLSRWIATDTGSLCLVALCGPGLGLVVGAVLFIQAQAASWW